MADIGNLIAEWKQELASLKRQLQMLESDKMHTGANILGSKTKETTARVKDWIAKLDALISEHSNPKLKF
jgi:hypothetical protein